MKRSSWSKPGKVRLFYTGLTFLLRVDDVTVCSVPPQWTDLAAPDPEIVIGEYRGLFRVADLLELERLVDQLRKRESCKRPGDA